MMRRRYIELEVPMRMWTCLLLPVVIAGCSSYGSTESNPSSVTIRITNTTCASGTCTPLRVLAFPFTQPHTPGGYWSLDLGVIRTASACVTLPPSASFSVTDAGSGKVTTYSWTTSDGVSLGAIAESSSRIQASPSTNQFVPTNAAGWSVALPSESSVTSGSACE